MLGCPGRGPWLRPGAATQPRSSGGAAALGQAHPLPPPPPLPQRRGPAARLALRPCLPRDAGRTLLLRPPHSQRPAHGSGAGAGSAKRGPAPPRAAANPPASGGGSANASPAPSAAPSPAPGSGGGGGTNSGGGSTWEPFLKPIYIGVFAAVFIGGLLFASVSLHLTADMGFGEALTRITRRIFRSIAFRQLVVIAVAILVVRFALNNVLRLLAQWSSSPVPWDKSRVYYVMKEVRPEGLGAGAGAGGGQRRGGGLQGGCRGR
jgi:hypothetical protein